MSYIGDRLATVLLIKLSHIFQAIIGPATLATAGQRLYRCNTCFSSSVTYYILLLTSQRSQRFLFKKCSVVCHCKYLVSQSQGSNLGETWLLVPDGLDEMFHKLLVI